MSTYIGADPVQLDALGEHLLGRAALLDELRMRLTNQLYETGWDGPDADWARSEWDSTHAPALGSAAALFHAMSRTLFANAGQQRDASTADGPSGGGAGGRFLLSPMRDPGTDLRDHWLSIAADKAGIDMSAWDPARGADELKGTITDVYTYYGNLYLQNPDLQWAGMANMVGPSFAAGFFDLAMMRDMVNPLDDLPGAPPFLKDLDTMPETELKFYETTLLQMQKNIFLDMAVMHEAYLGAGMDGIRELGVAGVIDSQTVAAWEMVDQGHRAGDDAMVMKGNELLLLREQRDIIDRDYQAMYDHSPGGPAVTYMMGVVGEPSIPGAHSLGDYSHIQVTMETPGPQRIPFTPFDNPLQGQVIVDTPFPAGNLADFNTRWDYITHDTLPAYQQLLMDNPDQARAIIASDVDSRIEDYRIYNRLDSLGEHYATDWRVDFKQ